VKKQSKARKQKPELVCKQIKNTGNEDAVLLLCCFYGKQWWHLRKWTGVEAHFSRFHCNFL